MKGSQYVCTVSDCNNNHIGHVYITVITFNTVNTVILYSKEEVAC